MMNSQQTNIPLLPRIEPQMQLFAESDISFGPPSGERGRARDRSPSEELYDFATSKKAKIEDTAATSATGVDGINMNDPISSDVALLEDFDFSNDTPGCPTDDIRLVKVDECRWMCGVCKEAFFSSFGEGCIHEVVCKMIARDPSGSTLQELLSEPTTSSSNSSSSSSGDESKGLGADATLNPPPPPQASEDDSKKADEAKDDIVDSSKAGTEPLLKPSLPPPPPKPEEIKADSKKATPDEARKPTSKQGGYRTEAKVLNVSLIPKEEQRDILSDYNYTLTQNIELFETVTKMPPTLGGMGGNNSAPLSYSRVGLRCIHCSGHSYHITAASFFPSSTASIASGLGTIGARHFLGEKCPCLPSKLLQQLRLTKKHSQFQTRSVGRVGLDAYCKDLAKKNGISTHDAGGIYFVGEKAPEEKIAEKVVETAPPAAKAAESCVVSGTGEKSKEKPTTSDDNETPKQDAENAPAATDDAPPQEEYTGKPEKIEASSFVPGRMEHFWECKHCAALPVSWRVAGSVVFSSCAPSLDVVKDHLEKCQGLATLSIPRNAEINIGCGKNLPPIRISWDNSQLLKKAGNIERLKATRGATRKNSLLPSGEVKLGVEKTQLVVPEDKDLTTDFAYTTMTLLKKCFLTKSGGSRGNCPLGYPGLACTYCAGQPNERRFFYTSADHLRNSFSHIPSHLISCHRCPKEIKQSLEALKALRNQQKAQLNVGSHKIFIDRVWSRLHGPNDVRYGDDGDQDSESSDDESEVSIGELDDSAATVLAEMKASTRSAQPPAEVSKIEFGSSSLVVAEEKHLTTDFAYLSLLQCEVYNLTHGDLSLGIGEVGLPVLSCKHCKEEHGGRKLFLARSATHLRNTLSSVSNHLAVCPSCPQEIKVQLDSVRRLRADQEADLKRGMHLKFCEKVWSRLIMHDTSEKPEIPAVVLPNGSSLLVLPEDQALVSDFTHYTMTQMVPCILEATGNGARSTFEPGWPGLACMHCAGQPNARKFYYRNCEILSGNYAHVPNHIMACRQCPLQVKAALAEKKKIHPAQKAKLSKGSQRQFFARVWARLHANRATLMKQNADTSSSTSGSSSSSPMDVAPIAEKCTEENAPKKKASLKHEASP